MDHRQARFVRLVVRSHFGEVTEARAHRSAWRTGALSRTRRAGGGQGAAGEGSVHLCADPSAVRAAAPAGSRAFSLSSSLLPCARLKRGPQARSGLLTLLQHGLVTATAEKAGPRRAASRSLPPAESTAQRRRGKGQRGAGGSGTSAVHAERRGGARAGAGLLRAATDAAGPGRRSCADRCWPSMPCTWATRCALRCRALSARCVW
jgi:hypothetical protein